MLVQFFKIQLLEKKADNLFSHLGIVTFDFYNKWPHINETEIR